MNKQILQNNYTEIISDNLETPVFFEKKIIQEVTYSAPLKEILAPFMHKIQMLRRKVEHLERRLQISPLILEWDNEQDDEWNELPAV